MRQIALPLVPLLFFACEVSPSSESFKEPQFESDALAIDAPATAASGADASAVGENPRDLTQNQRQNQVSPSGKYVLSVGTYFRLKVLEPVHRVTITSPDGALLYQDVDSRFFAGQNVYFGWDGEDRVWLYNSDDAGIWCWELVGDEWQKSRASEPALMPEWILPDYARPQK